MGGMTAAGQRRSGREPRPASGARRYWAVVRPLRLSVAGTSTRLTAENAALTALPAPPPVAVAAEEDGGQPAQEDVPTGRMGMFALGPGGQPLTDPADPSRTAAEPSAQEQSLGPDGAAS